MFDGHTPAKEKIVLDFGNAPVESFSGLVEIDKVPEYVALDKTAKVLKLSPAQEVEDEATVLFRAFGLI